MLDFIKQNPQRSAILLQRNDTIMANHNPNKVMPLASTVKIIIAIEYSYQAREGIINPNEKIDLNQVNKFHIRDTDGNAHLNWISSVSKKTYNNKIEIREIVKGMIRYSSNANTEWLIEKLGLNNINNRIKALKLQNHSAIYYFVSALFVPIVYYPNLHGERLKNKMKSISKNDYIEKSNFIHLKLKIDTAYKNCFGKMDMNSQKIWSDNLPSSTVKDYVNIMKKINSRAYFDNETQIYLEDVMEYILKNPKNNKQNIHIGMKSGSTAFVLTKALYSTDKYGEKIEFAYFFNNLSVFESVKLQKCTDDFDLKILTSKEFRETLKKELKIK